MSSNTVGYEKINVPANKMDIVGAQFQSVGENGFVDIQDITVEGYGEEGTDWIKIYDPDTSRYTTAYYYGAAAGGVYLDDTYNETTKLASGWGDMNQIVLDTTIDAGQAVWTQAETGGKLVIAGEVATNNTVVVPVNKMTLVANPLPMAVNIQQITVVGYGEEGTDWIKIYNPNTSRYTTAYYYGAAAGGVYLDDTYNETTKLASGWGDMNQIVIDTDIEIGQGFWTQAETGGKLVFPAVPSN